MRNENEHPEHSLVNILVPVSPDLENSIAARTLPGVESARADSRALVAFRCYVSDGLGTRISDALRCVLFFYRAPGVHRVIDKQYDRAARLRSMREGARPAPYHRNSSVL